MLIPGDNKEIFAAKKINNEQAVYFKGNNEKLVVTQCRKHFRWSGLQETHAGWFSLMRLREEQVTQTRFH